MTEWNASDYHHVSTLQEKMATEEIGRLNLIGTERVLDVGCGDGKIDVAIAALVPKGSVLGVDPSRNMVEFASREFATAERPNLRFPVADARTLPYQGEFDLVVSFNALHWVHDQQACLNSIHAALKPGGRALLRFVPREKGWCIEYIIEEVRAFPKWASYFAGFKPPFAHFTPDEYRRFAQASGLEVDHIQVEDRSWDFGSNEAFTAFCNATFVEWTRNLPEAQRAVFVADALAHYRAASCIGPNEQNVFKFQQMEVALKKPA